VLREAATQAVRAQRSNDHNGSNGCIERSLGFASVRSLPSKPPQTTVFGELKRTGANARQPLPCRRSWVRVPSSALTHSLSLRARNWLVDAERRPVRLLKGKRADRLERRPAPLPVFDWLGIAPVSASARADPPAPRPDAQALTPAAAETATPRLACRLFGHRVLDHVVDGHRLRNYAPGGVLRCARCGQVNRRWQGWR
jgi:hypothetical protein